MKIYIRGKQQMVEGFWGYIKKSVKSIKTSIISTEPEYEIIIESDYNNDYCIEGAIALFPNVKVRGCVLGDRDSVNDVSYLNQFYSKYGSKSMEYNPSKRKKIIDTYEEKVESYIWWDEVVEEKEEKTTDENTCQYNYELIPVPGDVLVDLVRYIGASDRVFIPKTINGNRVAWLEKNLFKGKTVKSVEFEKGFDGKIVDAFATCTDIEELIYDFDDLKDVNICKIFRNSPALFPQNCFINNHRLAGVSTNYSGDFVIDDNYDEVNRYAFDGCKKIKRISFEGKWKSIVLSGDFKFKLLDTRNLERLTIWGTSFSGYLIEELLLSDELLRLRIEHVNIHTMIIPNHMHFDWKEADKNYYCRLNYPMIIDSKKIENKKYKIYLPNIPSEEIDKEHIYAFLSSIELYSNKDAFDGYIKKNGKNS